MYIVVILSWIGSVSDEHHGVYLERSDSPEQARARLDYPEQVFDVRVKEVAASNIGLVYISD